MRTITIRKNVFTFDELSDDAKRAVCSREGDHVYYEFLYDDIVRMAEILGIEIDTRTVKLMGGGTRQDPCIYWSGFCSQGSGACFTGYYRYAKGSVKRMKAEAPRDDTLQRIAQTLQEVQRKNFYRLEAKIAHRDRYYHAYTMDIEVLDRENIWANIGDAEDNIKGALRDFANWMYEQIETEYEYQTSEEAVRETCDANGYEFCEDGSFA